MHAKCLCGSILENVHVKDQKDERITLRWVMGKYVVKMGRERN
jgi:hypothetical protein